MKLIQMITSDDNVTAKDDASFNLGLYGSGTYCIHGECGAVVIESNKVQLTRCEIVSYGFHLRIDGTEEVEIRPSAIGSTRKDVIVCKVTTGIDNMQNAVIEVSDTYGGAKGEDHIYNGSVSYIIPVVEVTVTGATITAIKPLATAVRDLPAIDSDVSDSKVVIATNKSNISTNKSNIAKLGLAKTGSGDTTVNSGVWTKVCSIVPGAGRMLITCGIKFQSNATGIRALYILKKGQSPSFSDYCVSQNAVNGNTTCMQIMRGVAAGATDEYELHVYQNSGSKLSVNSHMVAERIGV